MVRIDGERLLANLATLRTFGATGHGVVRPTYSDIDMQARRWLAEQMTKAGLDPVIDGVGNVYGRSTKPGPTVVLGSHSDTQPEGGWLDGAMGVMHAIEVAHTLHEDPSTTSLSVEAVSWADEEGTYAGFIGSRSFVDQISAADYQLTGPSGETVEQALTRLDLTNVARVRFEPHRHVAYLESHIEQGPHLEEVGLQIGAVTTIVGIRTMRIVFEGQQNHAGTTPMHRRRDAATALFRWANDLHDTMPTAASDTSVWTIGEVSVEPGAQSIVPGRAAAVLQFRDGDDAVLDEMTTLVRGLVDTYDDPAGVRVSAEGPIGSVAAAPMDADVVRHVCAAAEEVAPDAWTAMPSMAGHDAQILAPHLPCGMVFIPSIGGVSHDFAEDSRADDIVLGAQVLANATIRLSATR